jgi:hypothetical protein
MRRLLRRGVLIGEIVATYGRVRYLLRRSTLPEALAALRRGVDEDGAPTAEAMALGRHLASATVRTIRLLPSDSRCLMRSLVLTGVLARRGVGSTLLLSARPGPPLEAHAWVELAGQPLLAPGGPDHQPIARL